MAADLCIHIYEGITVEDMKDFFCTTLGSRWSPETIAMIDTPVSMTEEEYLDSDLFQQRMRMARVEINEREPRWKESYKTMLGTPAIWIGEVSWLKADLLDDAKAYIPDPIGEIDELIGEDLPVLDKELLEKIMAALEMENTTGYDMTESDKVRSFLQEHLGKRIFTISW